MKRTVENNEILRKALDHFTKTFTENIFITQLNHTTRSFCMLKYCQQCLHVHIYF